MVTVVISPAAAKQIDRLPLTIRARVLAIVPRLARWPDVSGAKPLHGDLAGHFRVRTGDYRVQVHLAGNVLVIEKVGHRDGFYDE
ncbi:MAG: type II toxin-antitoxin system RelE/ParE family toxin [Tepidisphaeraceae bacterium]